MHGWQANERGANLTQADGQPPCWPAVENQLFAVIYTSLSGYLAGKMIAATFVGEAHRFHPQSQYDEDLHR
jgi:hypothetical protein